MRSKSKWQRRQSLELAVVVRDWLRKKRHLVNSRRSFDIAMDAVEALWPRPPVPKKRGIRGSSRARAENDKRLESSP